MAQHDYNIANQSGADFRADLNNALLAIATVNSGATEPSTTFAHQLWVDTSNSVLKIRNAADNAWITTGVSITASNTFTGDLTGNVVGNVTGNLVGNVTGDLTGNADSADTLSTARTISLSGDVVGSVSFDGSANVDIDTVVQINSITLGTDTTGDYVESMSGGTGVTVTGGTGEGSTPSIAIGQAVATTDDVTFNTITATDQFIGDIRGAVRFNAKADGALSKGDVVYISGVSGDVATVGQAKADDSSKMPAFGFAAEDANDNAAVEVVTFGTLAGLDTSEVSEGQVLYVSTTAGEYTTTKPTGESSQIQNIGKVIRSHAAAGSIKVGGAGRSNATPNLDNGKIFIGNGSNQSVTSTLDTSIVVENTNLYYTTARANTDFDSRLATKDTGDLTEGSNLYYTTARVNSDFDTRLATKSTTNLAEGTNLYYTTARFDSAFTSKDTDDLSEGTTNLYYTQSRFNSAFGNKTTADLTENTNLYYTDTRANSAIDARVTKAFVDALGIQATSVAADSVTLGTDTTGNYVSTITGTANKITVSGSGSESAAITLSLPDDVQIADSLTVAGNLTVNGTLTSLDTTNLDIEDNLFQLNAGLTGSPVNDSGMLINRGTADNSIFMWDESVDKFTLGLTTADGSATGNITLNSLGTLVANLEGAVTGTVSSLSNHDTDDLAEGSNLYYTDARSRSAISATGDISYNSSTGVISFTQSASPVTSVNTLTGAVVLDTDDIGEGSTNVYFTNARADTRINLQTGANLDLSSKSTSDLSEGTNLYYTDARARASISEDSTQLSYNSTTGVLSYTQGDTDTVSEGTTNLYYTDARANSAIDARVTKSFVDALNVVAASATGNAGTATALATARDFSISGDITASAVSFDGTGNVALSASIDANTVGISEINVSDGTSGQVLTTDGAGNLSFSSVSGTTINNNADNRVITGSGTANTLNGEANFVFDGTNVGIGTDNPDTLLHLNAVQAGSVLRLARQDGSVVANDSLGKIEFYTNDVTNTGVAGYIDVQAESGSAGGAMIFGTGTAGSASEQVRISSNGNVGIGTDNPSQPLTVSKAGDLYIQVNNSSAGFNTYLGTYTNESRIVCDGAKPIAFFVNGSRVVDFANGGNVGINTSSPTSYANSQATLVIQDTGSPAIAWSDTGQSKDWFAVAQGSGLYFNYADGGGSGGASNVTDVLVLDNSGNVGIGLTNPTATLDVNGTIKLDGNYPTGTNNVALGDTALDSLTSGNYNTAIGNAALSANTTGTENVAIGASAGQSNTTGNNNVFVGRDAGVSNTTAGNNTFVGERAGQSNTTGDESVAVGQFAYSANTTGIDNVAIGRSALAANTTASYNVAVGRAALLSNTTGDNLVAVGAFALDANTTGRFNVAMGTGALGSTTTGNSNVGIGQAALNNNTASNNTAVGADALAANTTGTGNTAVGAYALDAAATATSNTAVGESSMSATTTGYRNCAFGQQSMLSTTTGSFNTAYGFQSLKSNTAHSGNTAIGYQAMEDATGAESCVAVGNDALKNSTADNNTVIGSSAGTDITSGGQNTIIGRLCRGGSAGAAGRAVIGYSAEGYTNNSLTIGYGTTDSNIVFGATTITAPSDIRLKEDIQDEEIGLDFINDLRPVTFRWKKAKDVPQELNCYEDSEERVMNGKYNHGFIAQEVKEVIDKYNFKDGFDMWSESETDGRQRVGETSLMPLMVKALQQLSSQGDELKAKLNEGE